MEKKEERLKKQMDFLLEADKLKFITRQTYLSDGKRKENDGAPGADGSALVRVFQ